MSDYRLATKKEIKRLEPPTAYDIEINIIWKFGMRLQYKCRNFDGSLFGKGRETLNHRIGSRIWVKPGDDIPINAIVDKVDVYYSRKWDMLKYVAFCTAMPGEDIIELFR